MKVVIGLHDVSSTSRLTDFLRTLFAFDIRVDLVVLSRVTGAAAQYGLPEASKLLFKRGVSFLILQDIGDYREIFSNYKIIQYSASKGRPISKMREIGMEPERENVLLLFSGSDAGFTSGEIIEGAVAIRLPEAPRELPPESALSLVLHMLSEKGE
ncbi:MAG: RecB-family nuclease [Fervidicoccaceae archaeon]|jgi:SpoU rRNA methylase family enzyme|nr:MAG: hypothetical protein C0179_04380 [Fervidicoccus sp.]